MLTKSKVSSNLKAQKLISFLKTFKSFIQFELSIQQNFFEIFLKLYKTLESF